MRHVTIRRHRRPTARPARVTQRQLEREELAHIVAGLLLLALIYSKLLGLW